MGLSIIKSRTATPEEWDAALASCPHATFFHSREWAEIWQKYDGLVSRARMVTFSDQNELVLPCSFSTSMKGLMKRVEMSPRCTFGGALYQEKITVEHLKLLVEQVRKFDSFVWRQNPYERLIVNVWPEEAQIDDTYAIDLRHGFKEIEKTWANGKGAIARKIRKARREGVSVREAISEGDWVEYYKAYEDSLRRWGKESTSRYEWKLFQILLEKKSPRIKLWLAEKNGELTSGALCFYQNGHAVYWHGAAYNRFFSLRPVNILMSEVIKDACERGFLWFDFNPSGGHKSVKRFKKSFGCKVYRSSVFKFESNAVKRLQFVRRILR